MRRNGHNTISGVKFDPKLDLSVPNFLYCEKFWKLEHNFIYLSQFSAAHVQKLPEFYFRSNFEPKIYNPHWLFSIHIRILVELLPRFIRVLSEKAAFVMNFFGIWGLVGVG